MVKTTTNPDITIRGGIVNVPPPTVPTTPPRHQPDTPRTKKATTPRADHIPANTPNPEGSPDVPAPPSQSD